ncbi:uncharacterized protein EV422DRAFT_622547 [Fimicolochytrium jonesii]|uniref:uncharacterized protein n=1 Tax=Fimicolochytrium jonesii TaxID=1396493 RepID=UPI0022FEA243|nr:uncharacterized protein EV422DRAFT_622547 [Fimicolochytrium jonesii]KAI8817596.1 hypothetical protein EV422DRAFT_622547 [Fimicolochytrium jonesii]
MMRQASLFNDNISVSPASARSQSKGQHSHHPRRREHSSAYSTIMAAGAAKPNAPLANNKLRPLSGGASTGVHLTSSQIGTLDQKQIPRLTFKVAPFSNFSPLSGYDSSIPSAIVQQPTQNEFIQSMWGAFDAMPDAQRNSLLRGLVARCGESQVDSICTWLNLKLGDAATGLAQMPTVHPEILPSKYSIGRGKKPPGIAHPDVPAKDAGMQRGGINLNLYSKLLHTSEDNIVQAAQPCGRQGERSRKAVGFKAPAHPPETKSSNSDGALMSYLSSRVRNLHQIMETLAQTVSEGADVETALIRIYERAQATVCAAQATLYVIDQASNEAKVIESTWRDQPKRQQAGGVSELVSMTPRTRTPASRPGTTAPHPDRIPVQRLYAGSTLLNYEVVNLYNVKSTYDHTSANNAATGTTSDSNTFSENEILDPAYDKLDVQCILTVPILSTKALAGVHFPGSPGGLVGIIELINKTGADTPPFFTTEDEFVAKTLASVATMFMVNTGGTEQLVVHQTADLKTLLDNASVMTSDADLNDLMPVIMHTVKDLLQAERCSLFLLDRDKEELWTSVAQGTQEIRIPMNKGIAGYVATTGKILNIPNAYKDGRFNREIDLKTGFHTRNILCMPMRSSGRGNQVIGVIQIINKLPDPSVFGKEDELLLGSFSALAGGMLDKTMAMKAMQIKIQMLLAQRDALIKGAECNPLTIIMLDLNGKLVSINHHETLSLADMSVLNLSTYDTWLGDNSELIDDIRSVYETGNPAYGARYPFLPPVSYDEDDDESNRTILLDYTIAKAESDSVGVVVVIELVGEERSLIESLTRYLPYDVARQTLSGNRSALKGKEQQASVLSIEVQEVDRGVDSSVISTLSAYTQPVIDEVEDGNGLLSSITATSATAVFGAPFGETASVNAVASVTSALKIISRVQEVHKASMQPVNTGVLLPHSLSQQLPRGSIFGQLSDRQGMERAPSNLMTAKASVVARNTSAKERSARAIPPLKMGLVIATDSVVTGCVGKPPRLEYLLVGDGVKTANALHELTKVYMSTVLPPASAIDNNAPPPVALVAQQARMSAAMPLQQPSSSFAQSVGFASQVSVPDQPSGSAPTLIICDRTKQLVTGHFHIRELDAVYLPDRRQPDGPPENNAFSVKLPSSSELTEKPKAMLIHQVLAPSDARLEQSTLTALICYELGLSEYRAQNFSGALHHFRKAIALTGDAPSTVMGERCRLIIDGAVVVPENWDGVWVWN